MKNFDDEQLRHLLQKHEFEFMPQAWENMQQKLQPAKKTRALAWWWASVGFCSVLGISFATYAFWFSNAKSVEMLPNQQIMQPVSAPKIYPQASQEQPTAYYSNPNNAENNPIIAKNSTQSKPQKISDKLKTAKKQLKKQPKKAANHLQTPKLLEIIPKTENKSIVAPQPMAYAPEFCPAELKSPTAELLPQPEIQEPAVVLAKNKNRRLRAQIWFGLNANSPAANTVALGLQMGAGADYQISRRQHISAGLQYKQLFATAGLVGTTIPTAASYLNEHNFDPNSPLYSKTQVYELQRVDLLELPLTYHFQLAPRHSIQAIAKVGLVIHAATLNANEQQPAQLTLKDMNLARTTAALGVGYEWRIGKKWAITAQANLGLNNLALHSQKEFRAYTAYAGENAQAGELFLMLNDAAPKASMLRMPEKLYNSDVQLGAKYTF